MEAPLEVCRDLAGPFLGRHLSHGVADGEDLRGISLLVQQQGCGILCLASLLHGFGDEELREGQADVDKFEC